MKKIIKISLLILLIVFSFGLTTSNAADEDAKGFTTETKTLNGNEFCIQRNVMYWKDATYKVVLENNYPGDDSENGHAIAYIYGAKPKAKSGVSVDYEELRQGATWGLLDQSANNDLNVLAKAYQSYKKSEKDFKMSEEPGAKTFVSDGKIIYGPLKMEYSYSKATTDTVYDEWGGFTYAFFDEDGKNVSDKVKLSVLENGSYKDITSTLIESKDKVNGYYKVTTGKYSGVNIYISTTDKMLTKVNLKVRANIISYKAKVSESTGTYYLKNNTTWYCDTCKSGNYVSYKGALYELASSKTETVRATKAYNLVYYGSTSIRNGEGSKSDPEIRYVFGGKYYSTYDEAEYFAAQGHYPTKTWTVGQTAYSPGTKYARCICGWSRNTVKLGFALS